MAKTKVVIVTRQLPGMRPVPSLVREIPENVFPGNTDTYAKKTSEEHIAAFRGRFVEFTADSVKFYTDVVEVETP